jgi:hypothetical protein
MHRFFEENPAFLSDALLGIPLSHRPVLANPARFTPDYSVVPILGTRPNSTVQIVELKGPAEKTLTGKRHRGFTSKVTHAVDQIRDYERYLRDPANAKTILASFGGVPDNSKLAVLIGRKPRGSDQEVFLRRKSEASVNIITYDAPRRTSKPGQKSAPLTVGGWSN